MEYFEVVQTIRESLLAGMQSIALYMTTVSGFLIASYTAGKSLSRFQVFLVTSLFIAFSMVFTIMSYLFFLSAHSQSVRFGGDLSIEGVPEIYAIVVGLAQLFGIVGSLLFLYRVRKG